MTSYFDFDYQLLIRICQILRISRASARPFSVPLLVLLVVSHSAIQFRADHVAGWLDMDL